MVVTILVAAVVDVAALVFALGTLGAAVSAEETPTSAATNVTPQQ